MAEEDYGVGGRYSEDSICGPEASNYRMPGVSAEEAARGGRGAERPARAGPARRELGRNGDRAKWTQPDREWVNDGLPEIVANMEKALAMGLTPAIESITRYILDEMSEIVAEAAAEPAATARHTSTPPPQHTHRQHTGTPRHPAYTVSTEHQAHTYPSHASHHHTAQSCGKSEGAVSADQYASKPPVAQ